MAKRKLTSEEALNLSLGLVGNPKPFDSSTTKDETNVFHLIQILVPAVFESLTEKTESGTDINWVDGNLSGQEATGILYSSYGFTDIKLTSGVIKAISIDSVE